MARPPRRPSRLRCWCSATGCRRSWTPPRRWPRWSRPSRPAPGRSPSTPSGRRATATPPRAYLVQLRREGSGTALVDPIAFDDLTALNDALGDAEWILHAASQDLACLAEVGLRPTSLFDTELAGRLLGYPRVGLATLVESVVGFSLRKEHSAVDWSTRPLPEPVAGVRRPRRRGAHRAARGARRRARGDRQGRVGTPGVRAPRRRGAQRPPAGPVAPDLGHAPGPRPPRPGRRTRAVAGPRRHRPAPRRDPGPDHPGLLHRRGGQRDAPRQAVADRAQGLPRPRRRALRAPVGRGAARRPHAARRGPAAAGRPVRRTSAAARLGRP